MKCYIYCPKAKPYLLKIKSEEVGFMSNYKQWLIDNDNRYQKMAYNGKIVASFDLNKFDEIEYSIGRRNRNCECYIDRDYEIQTYFYDEETLLKKSCVTRDELYNYFVKELDNNETYLGYAWHIENIEILDKPIEFGKHTHDNNSFFYTERIDKGVIKCGALIKAPQSWQYVYDKNHNKCILISIKPEWVCKILNREKTIELRKTAPKELIK